MLLCLAGGMHALLYSSHVVDDAYITYRYADNLAAGQGLSYNPPKQVEGYSNFLLVLILALGAKCGISTPLLSQIIGIFSFLILIVLLFRFEEEQNGTGWLSLMAPAMIALSVACAYWAVAGLETMPYTLLITSAVYFTSRASLTMGEKLLLSAILCGIVLMRTDGALFAFIIAVSHGLNIHLSPKEDGQESRNTVSTNKNLAIALISTVIVTAILFHGFRFLWFGTLSSGPSIAKLAGAINPIREGLRYTALFVTDYVPVVMVMGIFFSFIYRNKTTLPLVALTCGQFIIALAIAGDWMLLYRLYVPILPLLMLETSRMIRYVLSLDRKLKIPVFFLFITILVKLVSPTYKTLQEMSLYDEVNTLAHSIARDLKENYRSKSSLLLGDIGIIGYDSGFDIIDMKGLVSPWICSTYKIVKEGDHLRTTLDTDALLDKVPDLILVAIHGKNLSKTDFQIVDGREQINPSKVQGYWSCNTSLLENVHLQEKYKLTRQYTSKGSRPLSYLLFEKR